MPRIDITLASRVYPVTCDAGQEGRVEALAGYVDSKVRQVSATAGANASEARVLVLTALLLADELFDLKGEAQALRQAQKGLDSKDEDLLVAAVEHLSTRIRDMSTRMERG